MTDAFSIEPIALIGLACRVPGARDANQFWSNLAAGVESLRTYTREEQLKLGVPEKQVDHPDFIPVASVLDDIEYFDPGFFGMTGREADVADPQHRLFLELAQSALDDSGYDTTRYKGTVGVYTGTGEDTYLWNHVYRHPRIVDSVGRTFVYNVNSPDYVATLAAYKLNLRGPSLTLHTACSTSLVAIHLAAEAVRNGECDMALAGGVCIELPHGAGYIAYEGGISSQDGHCRPFDSRASGTVWASGGGVVVLKRLSDALADGDNIRSLILGNAINNDGAVKVGFTAPSVEGQTEVISQALAVAGIEPRSVSYVEAHGTGTILGDPIEVTALTRAYGHGRDETGWCRLGSVKSNFGHLSQAAGVIGVIKTVLAMEHELIPPSLHFEQPNPGIDFDSSPFRVNSVLSTWKPEAGRPRRAGVSSFGIGGTNAHVILQEAPRPDPGTTAHHDPVTAAHHDPVQIRDNARILGQDPSIIPDLNRILRPVVLRVSARSETAVTLCLQQLSAHLAAHPELRLADVAHTLRAGRTEHAFRAAVVAETTAGAAKALGDRKRVSRGEVADGPPRVAFLFSGQGSQYAGMAAQLYAAEPAFREAVDRCTEILGHDPLAGDDQWLGQTEHTQPALFTVEYALAQLWQSWGVRPAAMLGHSIGEYVAATLAGVFTLPDALRLVATRGRLMQSMPPGAMLAVQSDVDSVAADLPEGLSVSVVNGPGTCVVGGPAGLVTAYAARLEEQEIGSRMLRTSHAFHSPMMEPILAEFTAAVAAVPRQAPSQPFLSNRTGGWITAEDATDPAYWAAHLRETVRFGDCLATLLADGDWQLIECGPGQQLAGLARMQAPARTPLASLPGPGKGRDLDVLYATAGKLWTVGVPVEHGEPGRRVALPPYPFERAYHWIEAGTEAPAAEPAPAVLDMAQWCSVPVWRQLPPVTPAPPAGSILVIGSGGAELAERLGAEVTDRGSDYATAIAGRDRIVYLSDGDFFDLLALGQALAGTGPVHLDIVTAGAWAVVGGDATRPEHAVAAGFAAVLPLESPQVSVRHIDAPSAGVASLAAEVLTPAAHATVALRSGRRWIPEYAEVALPAEDPAAIRDGGVYLITGGLGGIGITLAEDLGIRRRAKLVLVSRSGLTGHRAGRARAAAARIEAAGGEVLVLAADVTDAEALRGVRAAILDRFGRLDGIVHAAGTPGGGLLEVKTRAAAEAVLAPKIAGTLALAEAFGDLELDFAVLCSSVTGVVGGLGQADYAAANAFLDAYAHRGEGFRTRIVSINWGGWLEVGMAAEVARPAVLQQSASGPSQPVDHPILTAYHSGPDGALGYATGTVSPDTHWVLGDHHVAGVPVMPGTGHLETARAAIAAAVETPGPDAVVELRDVSFLAPMAVPPGTSVAVQVGLEPSGDPLFVDFEIATDEAAHVRGTGGWIATPPPAADLAAIRQRCEPLADMAQDDPNRPGRLVQFGPHWQHNLAGVHEGATEGLARLSLSTGNANDLDRWVLHPALLDIATSFLTPGEEGSFLPLGYGRLTVHGPLPASFWAYARRQPSGAGLSTVDLQLIDDSGAVVVDIADFVMRQVDAVALSGTLASPESSASSASSASSPPAGRPGRPAEIGIRPEQGAEVFRRLLSADLGPQIIVNVRSVADALARVRAVTTGTVADGSAEDLAVGGAAVHRDRDFEAPRTALEAQLAAIWAEVLGVADVARDDDFFELGGNSLVAVQLVAQVRKATGVRLPMRSLFEAKTVAAMAEQMEKLSAEPAPAATTIPRLARPQ